MSLSEILENEIRKIANSSFDFSIRNKQNSYNGTIRTYFSFFQNSNSEKGRNLWEVELSMPRIDDVWNNEGINIESFFNNCILALFENFDIKIRGKDVQFEKMPVPLIENEILDAFNLCKQKLGSVNKNIIFIKDKSSIGKTEFMQFCYAEWKQQDTFGNCWWLDFNGGGTNICNFVYNIFNCNFQNNNFIIVDNIECCGPVDSEKIVRFLIELTNKILGKGKSLKLYIIRDSDKDIIKHDNKNIVYFDNCLSNEIKSKAYEEKINGLLYVNAKKYVKSFIQDTTINAEAKEALIKVLYFSSYNVNIKLKNRDICKLLLENIKGLKLMYDGELKCFPRDISIRLIEDFTDEFKNILKDRGCGSFGDDILEDYYDTVGNIISIIDFYNILKYSNHKNHYLDDFCSILSKAENACRTIAEIVLKNDDNKPPFGGHLGAILFAAEALSVYANNDTNALHAWIRLYSYIKKTYYIDGQENKLPEIHDGAKHSEGTIRDFKQGKKVRPGRNCIENQICLQDEVLSQCGNSKWVKEIRDSELSRMDNKYLADDTLFNFYLSFVQKQTEADIDIDKFFNTYILALLFEFEICAPNGLRDELRIEKLWHKIKSNCISKGSKYMYFYPARVPWVTARMLLAMCMYCKLTNPNQQIVTEINETFKENLSLYLLECSITFNLKGQQYRFWTAGTGLWNSTLETTMMCSFAIMEAAFYKFEAQVEESKRFINLFKAKWFENERLADGIWAYQTTELNDLSKNNIYSKVESFNNYIKDIDFSYSSTPYKNDKSLGISHIAKTLIDLVKRFVNVKPLLFKVQEELKDNGELQSIESEDERLAREKDEQKIENIKKQIISEKEKLDDYILHNKKNPAKEQSVELVRGYIKNFERYLNEINRYNFKEIEDSFAIDLAQIEENKHKR